MKKTLTASLFGALLLSASACGGSGGSAAPTPPAAPGAPRT